MPRAHVAAWDSDVRSLRVELARDAAARDARDKDELTPLHWAARNLCHAPHCVEALLAAGADKDAKDNRGATPLHLATAYGVSHCVAALLRAGADYSVADVDGWTPLHYAAESGSEGTLSLLLGAGARHDSRTRRGATPLHLAGRSGSVECVRLLLQRGADPTAATTSEFLGNAAGSSPAEFARMAYGDETARLLRREELAAQLAPLLAAAARGQVFAARLYEAALWRLVGRFAVK